MAESKKSTIEDRAREIASPLIAAEGLDLLDVEFVREHEGSILRLYIDRPGARVGVDDCTQASRAVETAFDVEDIVPHEYHLEVSSPGLNRPLTRPDHFKRVQGQKVRVKTFAPVGTPPRKNFVGTLSCVAEETVEVAVEGAGTFRIPYKDIAKANLEHEF